MKKILVLCLLLVGCGNDCVYNRGDEGEACYPNNTCKKPLVCGEFKFKGIVEPLPVCVKSLTLNSLEKE